MGNTLSSQKRRVAIYIRVSTTEQKINGYSLEAQEKRLRDYIKNNSSLEIDESQIKVFADVHTGSDFNRPKLQNMLSRIKNGFKVVSSRPNANVGIIYFLKKYYEVV